MIQNSGLQQLRQTHDPALALELLDQTHRREIVHSVGLICSKSYAEPTTASVSNGR